MSKETNGYHYHDQDFEEEQMHYDIEEESLLTDTLDHEILMHRDAHFGGSFDVMIDYYSEEKVGANPDFDLERIEYLAGIEKEIGKDLAPQILSGAEAEAVARSRQAYRDFKKIYENEKAAGAYPKLIADLILSEEEDPTDEIEAIVGEGSKIVPSLLSIIKSDEAYDSLFPGYGFATYLALLCLGKIKDPATIIPIFETLHRETIFGEDAAIDALQEIGEPAKKFLLELLASRPLTRDNVQAASTLSAFPPDEKIAKACFTELQDREVRSKSLLASFLLLPCDLLEKMPEKEAFIQLSKDSTLPKTLRDEMERIIRTWEK